MSYLVKYEALGTERSAGPYETKDEALEHARDIATYEYIRDVRVVPHPKRLDS